MSSADPIRVCVAGLGGRGLEQIDALAERNGQWKVVAAADRSAIGYSRFQAHYYDRRIPVLRNAAELVAFEPDAILVSTTAAAHVPVSLELLEAGYARALLIEKPIASSVAAGRSLEAAVESWPGRAGVDFQRRCSRMYAEAARILASGELGRVRSIRYATEKLERISMDASHEIDLANWLAASRPARVTARLDADAIVDRRGAVYFDPSGVVDVQYESGATFRLDTTGSASDAGLSVNCDHGSLTVEPGELAVVVTGPEGERTVPTDAGETPRMTAWFESTLRALAAGDGAQPCTVAEGVRDLEVVAGAFISGARGGGPIALPLSPDDAALELPIA